MKSAAAALVFGLALLGCGGGSSDAGDGPVEGDHETWEWYEGEVILSETVANGNYPHWYASILLDSGERLVVRDAVDCPESRDDQFEAFQLAGKVLVGDRVRVQPGDDTTICLSEIELLEEA